MASNQAAFLDGKDQPLRVGPTALPQPGPDEVVIQNHAVAINPVDWKIQAFGFMIQTWPTVLGEDVAGTVHAVGSNVTRFQPGDRVMGHTFGLVRQTAAHGGFARYTAVPAGVVARIPATLSFAAAAVLPLAFDTALCGLAESTKGLGLGFPSLTPRPSGKTVVVWGGSSSVGALAIQLAVAAGATVIAVASAHNHALVRKAGAASAFDYNSPSVVEEVVAAVKRAGGEFAGIYDAISTDDSLKYVYPILDKTGSVDLATVLDVKDPPGHLKIRNIFAVDEMTFPAWETYIPQALEEGKLLALPEPWVIGKGLESVQKGMDANRKGVSGKKVVVEL